MKGETSGNTLQVVTIAADCDNDTLLIKAIPAGPVCHTGADTCSGEKNVAFSSFVSDSGATYSNFCLSGKDVRPHLVYRAFCLMKN